MPIKYSVRSNGLLGDKKRHAAIVRPAGTAELPEVVERMAWSGGSVPAILGVLEHFFATIEAMLRDGYNVNTPIANLHLSITGTFHSEEERFDPRKHKIVPRATAGKRLRRALRHGIQAQRVCRGAPGPYPQTYVDTSTGERNRVLTPGGLGRVTGIRLRFDPHDPRQGIFFIAADGRVTPVSSAAMNRSQQLIFLVPDLPPGTYLLEVRATADDSPDVRAGRLDSPLTVGREVPAPQEAAVEAEAVVGRKP